MAKTAFGTPDDYLKALRKVQNSKRMDLLWAHFNEPDHTTTWENLGAVTGHGNYRVINRQYGSFAGSVARLLGLSEKPLDTNRNAWWLWVLVDWAGKDDKGHQRFRLRDEVLK